LGLNAQSLRDRLRTAEVGVPSPPVSRLPPTFVEVAPLSVGGPRYVVELDVSGQVRLRVEVHGDGALDVESLARAVVRERACSR
jgi:hypothetical protein